MGKNNLFDMYIYLRTTDLRAKDIHIRQTTSAHGITSCMSKLLCNTVYQAGKAEIEIEDFTKKNKGTEIMAYALVDFDNEIAYGFKVRRKDKE